MITEPKQAYTIDQTPVLEVKELCKTYPGFYLQKVSFSLQPGTITGFIGRNGAGKSTALNAILNLIHAESGTVRFRGTDLSSSAPQIKQKIGYVSNGMTYYDKKKLRKITNITKQFYSCWDEASYRRYLDWFHLDEQKTPSQLSEGMKVKYALALALSHQAELLILDEPTSGLDPVSREELLGILKSLREKGKTILFSTHITWDLEKCADRILYIRNGSLIADEGLEQFKRKYGAHLPGASNLEEIMLRLEQEGM